MCACMCVFIVYLPVYIYVCVVCVCIYIYIYMCVCVCVSVCACMCVYIRKRPNQEFFAEPEPNLRSFLPNRTFVYMNYDLVLRSYQLKLIKMLAELANLNHCAVPFLSRAAVNLNLYNSSPVMK